MLRRFFRQNRVPTTLHKLRCRTNEGFHGQVISVYSRWKLYKEILEKENINTIKPNPVLYNKLDIDQMKTLNNLRETIEKK
jgi:hypothetical protein